VRGRDREATLQKKMLGVACIRVKMAMPAVAVRLCRSKREAEYQVCLKAQGLPKGWRLRIWSQMEAWRGIN
jgi:hypothetical protein